MNKLDFNLLIALDVLLSEENVSRAAKKLQLSPSAMSRTLERLRKTTSDPLLVRAGRSLVLTPRAIDIKKNIKNVILQAESILQPANLISIYDVERTFTLRTSDGFVDNFGAKIIQRVQTEAPKITLNFIQKNNRDSNLLRDGTVDIETGVISSKTSPELRVRALFRDHFIGVIRKDHPYCSEAITNSIYNSGEHILISTSGYKPGPIDLALKENGYQRKIKSVVSNYATALSLVRETDLIATVPAYHTQKLRKGLFSFSLPFQFSEVTISMIWHPRMETDPVHRWIRQCIIDICSDFDKS